MLKVCSKSGTVFEVSVAIVFFLLVIWTVVEAAIQQETRFTFLPIKIDALHIVHRSVCGVQPANKVFELVVYDNLILR